MTSAPAARTFEVRHLQLARAAFAAIAAVMVTFSPDHSAAVGMAIFSGFAIANALVLLIAVVARLPGGSALAGGGARRPVARSPGLAGRNRAAAHRPEFFVIVIAWALATGIVESESPARARTARLASRLPAGRMPPAPSRATA